MSSRLDVLRRSIVLPCTGGVLATGCYCARDLDELEALVMDRPDLLDQPWRWYVRPTLDAGDLAYAFDALPALGWIRLPHEGWILPAFPYGPRAA